jgi:hypothetical protein
MKSVPVREAAAQLERLVAEAARGDVVVLTAGDVQVTLTPRSPSPVFDPEEDSAELETELLKAVREAHAPFGAGELREIAARAITDHRTRKQE